MRRLVIMRTNNFVFLLVVFCVACGEQTDLSVTPERPNEYIIEQELKPFAGSHAQEKDSAESNPSTNSLQTDSVTPEYNHTIPRNDNYQEKEKSPVERANDFNQPTRQRSVEKVLFTSAMTEEVLSEDSTFILQDIQPVYNGEAEQLNSHSSNMGKFEEQVLEPIQPPFYQYDTEERVEHHIAGTFGGGGLMLAPAGQVDDTNKDYIEETYNEMQKNYHYPTNLENFSENFEWDYFYETMPEEISIYNNSVAGTFGGGGFMLAPQNVQNEGFRFSSDLLQMNIQNQREIIPGFYYTQ